MNRFVASRARLIVVAGTVFLLASVCGLNGCFNLDEMLFDKTALSSYSLGTTVIPESSRTQVVLTSQGKKIYGYFVKSNGSLPGITILYNHGTKDHLQYYWDRVELLYRTGANVFVYDYQGYGMSEGTPSEEGFYSDALAALTYVQSRSDVDHSRIVYYGFSLGCAAAVQAAAYYAQPRAIILESPFASTSALAQSAVLTDITSAFVMRGTYDNAEKIGRVHAPLLLMHGEDDTFIDIQKNGQVIFDHANEPKTFIRVKGAGHSGIPTALGAQPYIDLVRNFITSQGK
ncbi:MAG TPA: alpha/beta hydrolase [Bacteroidota bacterium]|nr:alpha/beta hydrolase [Bacteroidota bacterium]